jgi:hypothetical protein
MDLREGTRKHVGLSSNHIDGHKSTNTYVFAADKES